MVQLKHKLQAPSDPPTHAIHQSFCIVAKVEFLDGDQEKEVNTALRTSYICFNNVSVPGLPLVLSIYIDQWLT